MMVRALRRVVRGAVAGCIFAYFGLGGLCMSWVVLPLACLGVGDRDARTRRAHAVVARGLDSFHALIRWADFIDFDPRRCEVRLPAGPCVVVANHPTLVDTTVVMTAVRSACLVVKSSFFRSPLLRALHRHADNIEAVEDGPVGGEAVIAAALDRLSRGFPLLVFPEGTRSPTGGLRRFRRGAFEIALRARVPVVPLLITCDPPMLRKGDPWWAMPERAARLRVVQLPTLDPAAEGLDGSLAIARHVRALYAAHLPRTPSEDPS